MKRCAQKAFIKHQRSMLAGDMVQEISPVFKSELERADRPILKSII